MRTKRKVLLTLMSLALSPMALVPAAVAQQGSPVTGRVTDRATGEPMAGARVLLIGTSRAVSTDRDGTFLFRNVAVGRVELRVVAIGYESQIAQITVLTRTPQQVDFDVREDPLGIAQQHAR